MKLTANDQIHVSAVKSDSIAAGETFEVSDALGNELMRKHPGLFVLDAAEPSGKSELKPKNKAEKAAPKNK